MTTVSAQTDPAASQALPWAPPVSPQTPVGVPPLRRTRSRTVSRRAGVDRRQRFGLIFVDYATQTRIPQASAAWCREQIAAHTRTVGQDRPGLGTAGNTHHHKEMAR
ncbi:hypothetical protein BH11ACT1_BH11ACT1_02740 [soil metagenome]